MSLLGFLAALALGTALAASCGLRAFLPLFVVGLGGRFGFVDVGDGFAWLTSTPCLFALGTGVALELAGDKVPWLSHLLDALATPLRSAAGMLAVAATMVDLPTWIVALLAVIIGGGVALAVHTAKAGARLTTSAATAGAAAPAHSLLEDIVCAAASVLSVVFVVVAVIVAAAGVATLSVFARAVWRRVR